MKMENKNKIKIRIKVCLTAGSFGNETDLEFIDLFFYTNHMDVTV